MQHSKYADKMKKIDVNNQNNAVNLSIIIWWKKSIRIFLENNVRRGILHGRCFEFHVRLYRILPRPSWDRLLRGHHLL